MVIIYKIIFPEKCEKAFDKGRFRVVRLFYNLIRFPKAVTKTVASVVSFRESVVGVNRQKHSLIIPSEPSAERLVASTSAAVQRVSKWLRDAALMLRD